MSTADGGCGHATACEVTHHQPVQTEPRKLSPKPLTTAGITRQPVQSEPRELRPPHATRAKAEPPSPAAPAPEPAICGSYYGQELNMSPIATERMKADGFTGTFQILDDEYSHNPFQLGEVEDLTEEGSTEQSPDGGIQSSRLLMLASTSSVVHAAAGSTTYRQAFPSYYEAKFAAWRAQFPGQVPATLEAFARNDDHIEAHNAQSNACDLQHSICSGVSEFQHPGQQAAAANTGNPSVGMSGAGAGAETSALLGGVPSSALQGDMPTTPPAAGDGVSVYTATPPQAAKKQLKKTTGNRSSSGSSSGSGGGSSCSSSKRQRGMNYPCRFPGCGQPCR